MKTFLAVWMAIVSLGVTISHAHAAPDEPHVHGFGWNCPTCSHIRGTDDDEPTRPGQPHCHFILLGFELPGESAPPDGAAVQSVLAHESAGTAADNDLGPDAIAIPDAAIDASFEDVVHAPPILISTFVFSPLSAFASRALAGVLRS